MDNDAPIPILIIYYTDDDASLSIRVIKNDVGYVVDVFGVMNYICADKLDAIRYAHSVISRLAKGK